MENERCNGNIVRMELYCLLVVYCWWVGEEGN